MLETNTSTGTNGHDANNIQCSRLPNATINTWYNQIGFSVTSATGNYRLGVYADSASSPSGLLVDSGSIAVTADYALKSVTEFEITVVANWAASLTDGTPTAHFGSTGQTARKAHIGYGYSALENPITTLTDLAGNTWRQKITHS